MWVCVRVKNCMKSCFIDDEIKETTANNKVFRARHVPADWRKVKQMIDRLEQSLAAAEEREIKRILAELVPQYKDGDPLDIVKVA